MFLPKKGSGNNTKLYQTLEVEPTATDDEIKRAYKKLALKFHPDKAPGQEDKFKEISHAYNILSDPQKKEVYDNYGEEGLAFMDNGVFGEDGEFLQLLSILQSPVTMVLACIVGLLLWSVAALFPIFIVLKTDGVVDWSWPVVFIPLWILNIFPLIYTCCLPCSSGNAPPNPDDEEGAPRPKSRKGKILASFIQYFSALAFQIVLAIQLETHKYHWSLVFIPIYVFQGISTLKTLVKLRHSKYVEQVDVGVIGVEFGCGYFGYLWKGLVIEALRIAFVVLLVIKLENNPYSWWIVSIPIWIGIGWKLLLKTIEDQILLKGAIDEEDRARRKQMIGGLTCLMITVIAFIATFTGLVAAKLDGSSYSVAITFIPIFIILGLVFCCCCCCMPCVMCCMKGDEEPGMMGENENDGPFFEVKKQLYIENKPTENSPLKP